MDEKLHNNSLLAVCLRAHDFASLGLCFLTCAAGLRSPAGVEVRLPGGSVLEAGCGRPVQRLGGCGSGDGLQDSLQLS